MKSRMLVLILVLCLLVPLSAVQAGIPDEQSLLNADGLSWQAQEPFSSAKLTILGPNGLLIEQEFAEGAPLFWSARDAGYPDGEYSYELVLKPAAPDASTKELGRDSQTAAANAPEPKAVYGAFGLYKGKLVPVAGDVSLMDVVHPDDVIIQSSLCVGFDCVNGENFSFDTLRLKENNLRIHFQDTSNSSAFPSRDWRIIINDSANGGANYFAVEDADTARKVFLIEGGAPANALYVEDYGRVGMGTNTPVVELHIKDSDTPSVRLEQSSAGGWTPQIWDVAGNESNFFIRDATHGSSLPFRIQPGTPSSTLSLRSSGKVGIGTWSPSYSLEINRTEQDATMAVKRTDGTTGYLRAGASSVQLGSVYTHPLTVWVGTAQVAEFGTDGSLVVGQDGQAQAYISTDASAVSIGSVNNEPIKFVVNGNVVARIDGNGNLAITGSYFEGIPLSAVGEDAPIKVQSEVEALKAELAAQGEQIADLEARLAALEAALAAQLAPASARVK